MSEQVTEPKEPEQAKPEVVAAEEFKPAIKPPTLAEQMAESRDRVLGDRRASEHDALAFAILKKIANKATALPEAGDFTFSLPAPAGKPLSQNEAAAVASSAVDQINAATDGMAEPAVASSITVVPEMNMLNIKVDAGVAANFRLYALPILPKRGEISLG